ncbi:ABC transporter permease [Corynebacterium glyciniphilum]|uniref:ABC transporter permease n=1 Tax=Corynebacterium glyciniphilum TaxID=1404244 RepID=UPI0011AB31BD|nr:ABC transporter permease [Corynebacterium glyciniphilum]
MTSLINALRSETTKLLSMRSTLVYAILLTGALYGPVVLATLFSSETPTFEWADLMNGAMIFIMVAIVFAASTTAGDIRNHLHAQAFLTQRSRAGWVTAKILVTLVFAFITYVAGVALTVGAAAVLGANLSLDGGGAFTPVWSYLLGGVAFPLMAVGLACVLRSPVVSVAVPTVWFLLIDGMIGETATHIEAFRPLAAIAPGERLAQLATGYDRVGLGIDDMTCIAILVVWVVVLSAVGLWRNQRADVR